MPFVKNTAIEESARCLLCHDAPCTKACPCGAKPDRFIRSLRFDNLSGAKAFMKNCADCSAPCMTACTRAKIDRAVDDEVYSELLPADKVEKVEELIQIKSEKEKLAFVGDGINDAPVLRRADIGIAMGAMGSDAAIEAADVVLMDDDPMQISKAIKISRKCLGIVYQNIVFAIGIKLICLVLVALGIANMWLAVFADVGVMIIAVLNAIRALFVKNL